MQLSGISRDKTRVDIYRICCHKSVQLKIGSPFPQRKKNKIHIWNHQLDVVTLFVAPPHLAKWNHISPTYPWNNGTRISLPNSYLFLGPGAHEVQKSFHSLPCWRFSLLMVPTRNPAITNSPVEVGGRNNPFFYKVFLNHPNGGCLGFLVAIHTISSPTLWYFGIWKGVHSDLNVKAWCENVQCMYYSSIKDNMYRTQPEDHEIFKCKHGILISWILPSSPYNWVGFDFHPLFTPKAKLLGCPPSTQRG